MAIVRMARIACTVVAAILAVFLIPATAVGASNLEIVSAIDTVWVVVAAILVLFMQAGFMFLEMGFSRSKNAGTIVAKIITNLAITAVFFWAVGFAIAFGGSGSAAAGGTGWFAGDHGFFFSHGNQAVSWLGLSVDPTAFLFFQFTFAAVALAIVWGTTLERIKFGVYIIYGMVFAALIYPIVSHWIFGGGWLQESIGMQDFAGSTVVHVTGATAGLAVLLLLGARHGKYGVDGKPQVIPGHSMPFFGLAILILWMGWFGFNPGSTLTALGNRFAEVAFVTNLAIGAGILAAIITIYLVSKTIDISMVGNGAIAGAVGITGGSGYVELWAAPIIGAVSAVLVVLGILAIEKILDDPVGALSAHGIAGVWGTIALGLFASDRLVAENGVGKAGLFYSGSFEQLGAQALGLVVVIAFVFTTSFAVFWLIKKAYGLRVRPEEEEAGLDITEHGMYGYPEIFIPQSEFPDGVRASAGLIGGGSGQMSGPRGG